MILLLIFLSLWLGLALSSAFLGLSITALVFLLFVYKRFRLKALIVCSFFVIIGASLSYLYLIHTPKSSYKGLVYVAKENYFLFNSGGERLYVNMKNHTYDIGDYLTINGQREGLSFNTIESSFDFKNYLNKKGVYHALAPKKITINFHNPIRIEKRREKLLSIFNKEQRSIVGAILFSDGGDSELSDSLKNLHLTRFLSASGIFLGAFHAFFKAILSRHMKDKCAEAISIGILSLYAIFTFPRFSILKAMIFLIVRWINEYKLKKKYSYLTTLSFIGIICLFLNPYLARQESFVLGFSIPLVIYLTNSILKRHKIKKWFTRYLVIFLFFLPFEIAFYNKIVILSLPLQIIISPLFLLIGIVSLLCFFYVPIYPVIGFLTNILKGIVGVINPLSFGVLLPNLSEILVVVYYGLYIMWLNYLTKGFVPIHRFLLIAQLSIMLINAIPISNYFTNEVSFINVGQGDCTLIRDRDKVVLVDTGGLSYLDVGKDSLIPYLKKKRIYHINTVIITHYDFDHYGGLESLKKEYKIDRFVDYSSSFPIKVGNVTFNNYNYYSKTNDENDKSLVIGFNICEKDFLIMGDAPSYIEKEIIRNNSSIKCDILKVGHHGSNTSTCDDWIKYLAPKDAIISCGKNNRFGHPNKEVITVLNKYHVRIRRTDLEGTIVYKQLSIS